MTRYCEGDVLNTWLIYLRWLLLKGQLLLEEHTQWVQHTIHYLHTQPQHADFLSVWQHSSQQTEFTRTDFPEKSVTTPSNEPVMPFQSSPSSDI